MSAEPEPLPSWFRVTPESMAALDAAREQMDECWEVECRYGRCVCFVHPVDGDTGGWGDPECPCENGGASMTT